MHLSSLVVKTCQRLQLIFEEDPVTHNHSKYSINRFYPIFVEQPTISSPFVPLSLTMTTNLLPLTLSRPWPPLQLSFEEDPVTHKPSSSFPYFRTWWRNGGVSKDSWEGMGMCAASLLSTFAKRMLSTDKLHSSARWSSYNWSALIPPPWNGGGLNNEYNIRG